MNSASIGSIVKNELSNSKELIGGGPLTTVYKGTWRGTDVAIKSFVMRSLPPHLASEFQVYKDLLHPNIVKFFGVYDMPGKFSMVEELMYTNLTDYLKKFDLSILQKNHIGLSVALGLDFLHYSGVGHKHLKSNNVFLTKDGVVKITDFGLSKIRDESNIKPTVRWRAPETFTREYDRSKDNLNAQKSADVYSYGLILWQLFERRVPFTDKQEREVVLLLGKGTREEIKKEWPKFYVKLIGGCWSFVPSSRPTTGEILDAWKLDAVKVYVVFMMNNEFAQTGMKDIFPNIISYLDKL